MKRRWLTVIGALLLLATAGLVLAIAGADTLSMIGVITIVVFAIIGGLMIAAGEGMSLGPLEWYQSGGLAFVALGCWFAFRAGMLVPEDPTTTEWVWIVAGSLGGVALVFIGVDWIRGGYHVDLSHIEGGPLRGESAGVD